MTLNLISTEECRNVFCGMQTKASLENPSRRTETRETKKSTTTDPKFCMAEETNDTTAKLQKALLSFRNVFSL